MRKDIPVKRNPLFSKQSPLEFDNVSAEELTALTDSQRADRFMSNWMQVMHPFSTYRRYFDETPKSEDRILRDVKNYYSRYVVKGGWGEKKYVMIVDSILTNRLQLTPSVFDKTEKLYEGGRLDVQMQEKRKRRRRI